jgi:hypothetical protein
VKEEIIFKISVASLAFRRAIIEVNIKLLYLQLSLLNLEELSFTLTQRDKRNTSENPSQSENRSQHEAH